MNQDGNDGSVKNIVRKRLSLFLFLLKASAAVICVIVLIAVYTKPGITYLS